MRIRLDAELVRRGLAKSRAHADELIQNHQVLVNGIAASKASTQVDSQISIKVIGDVDHYVSRGAHKILGAIKKFGDANLQIKDAFCLDAGASTGGFTQVLLELGARKVLCVDVGYGQLAWQLQNDERVIRIDRTNIREVSLNQIADENQNLPSFVVADLSFISLKLVIEKLIKISAPTAQFLLLVKPQFELNAELVGHNGVVREPNLRLQAVSDVANAILNFGVSISGICASSLPGPAGNVEYFIWARKIADPTARTLKLTDGSLMAEIQKAIAEGPA